MATAQGDCGVVVINAICILEDYIIFDTFAYNVSMKLYLVRHGETTGNAQKLHQTATTPLSEVGLSQAKLVAHRFEHIQIDALIASDFVRAQQTAAEIAAVTGLPIESTTLLREVKRPTSFEGKHIHDPHLEPIKSNIEKHLFNKKWHFEDEENTYDLVQRAQSFLDQVSMRPEKNIVAVTHGLILRVLIGVMWMGPQADMLQIHELTKFLLTQNTGVTVCEKIEDVWKLHTWNDHAHL